MKLLGDVLEAVRREGVRAAVAGGLAQQVWGRLRATRDLDLLVVAADRRSFLEALRSQGLRPKGRPRTLGDVELHSMVREDRFVDVEVDLFFVRGGLGEAAVDRAVSLALGPIEAPVVTAEDLLLLKLLADRVLDRADIEGIVREQGERLDLSYLRRQAAALGLAERLERAIGIGQSE